MYISEELNCMIDWKDRKDIDLYYCSNREEDYKKYTVL